MGQISTPPATSELSSTATGFFETRRTPARTFGPNPLEGFKVLLIEDSPDNRTLIRLFLSHQGARVICAEDGLQGIENAFADEPDVILLDIQMPGMDGYDTIKALHARGFRRPIFALTAHALREERRKTAAAGFNGHLTKPIVPDEIIASILAARHIADRIPALTDEYGK